MQRKMLFFERLMYIDGATPINCVLTIRVRGTINPEHLRTAFTKIQAKHPILRARVTEEAGEPYFVIDDTAPEIPLHIVERTGDDDLHAITLAAWKLPFDTKRGPMLRAIWIKSDGVSELMLVGHHCICDGLSMMTLLREILQIADQPETELTPYHAYSVLEDLVPNEVLSDPKVQRRVRKNVLLYKMFLAVLSRRTVSLPEGNPYVLYSTIDTEQLATINHRCQAEDTTVYAAFCVAYLQAFREIQGKAARNKIMCPVSIRRSIRAIKSDMMFAFAPTVALSLPKGQSTDLWTLARQMKRSIANGIEDMSVYEDLMLGDRMRSSIPRVINFLRSSRGGHDLAFSNMGRVKISTKYKEFQVEAICGATVVPWRNTNTLLAWTYLNKMEFAFTSNERFLPERDALAIQQRALQILQDAMAIPVSSTVS